jgi:hypothetical protein
MRSKLGLPPRIHGAHSITARQRSMMWKTVWLLLAMATAAWMHSLPAQAQAMRTYPAPTTAQAPDPAPTSIARNIVTDFGATCNGVANDSRAFMSFNSWARTQTRSIKLTIPSGRICNVSSTPNAFAQGIKNLVVSGYGATLISGWLGGLGIIPTSNNNSRVATVKAGATSVTLLNRRQSSRFRVGSWAVLAGLDTQGEGFPPNDAFFEYVKINAINAATGQITFSNPIRNSYKSTWPHYPPPTAYDTGGPATLFALAPSWDTSVEYQGMTIISSQAYAKGRSVTFTDVTFNCSGSGGLAPTENLNITLNNVTQHCQMEVDKLVDNFTINGGTFDQLYFQSSSGANVFTMSNNAAVSTLNGTPQKVLISDSRIGTFYVGNLHFGRTTEISCDNCTIGAFAYPPGGSLDNNVTTKYSMTNGVIASPNSNGPVAWAVPGANIMFARYDGNLWTEGVPFQVIDVTQDATNTYIQTSLAGGFPSLPTNSTNGLSIYGHPAPKFTCTNCTGSADAVDLAQAPAGVPIFSYSKRTFTGNQLPVWAGGALSYARIWGAIVSVKINVTKPYTGARATLTLNALGPYGIPAISADGSQTGLNPAINLKIAGERVIFPSSVVGTQSGDIISAPGPMWFEMGYAPTVSADISGESPSVWPTVTIEITTDQGVVNP